MALYRTLLRSKKTGKELLREYKPHKRTILIEDNHYHLPMPYTLFLTQHWTDEELKPFIDERNVYLTQGREYLQNSIFDNLCIAFAKEPVRNFDSKIYAPMFPNIYRPFKDREPGDFRAWRVCVSDTDNSKYWNSDNIQESINEFWNSRFVRHEGVVGQQAIQYNYQVLTNVLKPIDFYGWWEDLENVEEALYYSHWRWAVKKDTEDAYTVCDFLQTFIQYDYEFIFENGFKDGTLQNIA
jgi:hypothetical protein